MKWEAGSKIALITNLALLGVAGALHARIATPLGFAAVLFSFGTTLVIFVEFHQKRAGHRVSAVLIGVNAVCYLLVATFVNMGHGVIGPDGATTRFSDALYFTMVTFTTLGYGDFRPDDSLRLIAATQAILGYLFLGLLIVFVTSWLESRSGPRKGRSRR